LVAVVLRACLNLQVIVIAGASVHRVQVRGRKGSKPGKHDVAREPAGVVVLQGGCMNGFTLVTLIIFRDGETHVQIGAEALELRHSHSAIAHQRIQGVEGARVHAVWLDFIVQDVGGGCQVCWRRAGIYVLRVLVGQGGAVPDVVVFVV
jgi:hypothetical protein